MPRGGRRPGAGRPKKGEERKKVEPQQATGVLAAEGVTDAKEFLERVLKGLVSPTLVQMDAARSLLPFQHKKLGETGKKEQKKEDAGKVSRFAPAPPRMAAIHGKKH